MAKQNRHQRILSSEAPRSREVASARRKLVAAALVTTGVAGYMMGRGSVSNPEAPEQDSRPQVTEVMGQGDTVWGHAKRVADETGADVRDIVDKIYEDSPDLADGAHPGDKLIRDATPSEQQTMQNQQPGNNG